jgi:hypothetical protein
MPITLSTSEVALVSEISCKILPSSNDCIEKQHGKAVYHLASPIFVFLAANLGSSEGHLR